MQVFKFGGASVKSADNIKNVVSIIEKYKNSALLVVVSAIGKTTDKLARITEGFVKQNADYFGMLDSLKQEHFQILKELFPDENHPVFDDIANTFVEIEWILEDEPQDDYDYLFDQIVSIGELLSTKIIAAYAQFMGVQAKWVDARDYILTDNNYREANVDWAKTEDKIRKELPSILDDYIIVTQGYIGSTSENFTTT